jgi:hypothetical protein
MVFILFYLVIANIINAIPNIILNINTITSILSNSFYWGALKGIAML